jgi:Flp pilus assembly protein TadB
MQQHYESFSSESERASGKQDARDIWSAGEKLQSESRRQKSMGGFLPLAPTVMIAAVMIIVIGMAVLFVAGVLVGILLAPILLIHGAQVAPIYP